MIKIIQNTCTKFIVSLSDNKLISICLHKNPSDGIVFTKCSLSYCIMLKIAVCEYEF